MVGSLKPVDRALPTELPSFVIRKLSSHSQNFLGMQRIVSGDAAYFIIDRLHLHITNSNFMPCNQLLYWWSILHRWLPVCSSSLRDWPFQLLHVSRLCSSTHSWDKRPHLFLTSLFPHPSKTLKKPSKTCRKLEYFVTNLWPSVCSVLGEDCSVICWCCWILRVIQCCHPEYYPACVCP